MLGSFSNIGATTVWFLDGVFQFEFLCSLLKPQNRWLCFEGKGYMYLTCLVVISNSAYMQL
ncbi:hypothetical protein RchiOBHm_Chr7g0217451 [Rosa chinensis]|uniref:Uncharacterized protein n=1 Tax=Rosa chinensis TaxID=74649 RepID=A0A2P6PC06_ROSCH|nr:hypothetical protein RchiOBHm_Chr7g0217451 [Rosa chinensis]